MPVSSMYIGASNLIQNFIISIGKLSPKFFYDDFFFDSSDSAGSFPIWLDEVVGLGLATWDMLVAEVQLTTTGINDTATITAVPILNPHVQLDDFAGISPIGCHFLTTFRSTYVDSSNGGVPEQVGLMDGKGYLGSTNFIGVVNSSAGFAAIWWKSGAGSGMSDNIAMNPGQYYTHEVKFGVDWIEWYIDGLLVYSNHAATNLPHNANLSPCAYVKQNGVAPSAFLAIKMYACGLLFG